MQWKALIDKAFSRKRENHKSSAEFSFDKSVVMRYHISNISVRGGD
jgi:hypothetical protein